MKAKSKGLVLQRGIRRLKSSGLTWQEIADYWGGNRGVAYQIASGEWVPNEERAEEIMRALPRQLWKTTPELEASVLAEIRDNHVGINNAIKSRYLARHLGSTDRMIRACVNSLRKRGYPICSSVGKPQGFYWPRSIREYKEFEYRDYTSRIRDMENVRDAMREGAEALFEGKPLGLEQQAEMFG